MTGPALNAAAMAPLAPGAPAAEVLRSLQAAFRGDVKRAVRVLTSLLGARRTPSSDRPFIVDILAPFLFWRGEADALGKALDAVSEAPEPVATAVMAARAVLFAELHQYNRSKQLARRALAEASKGSDQPLIARVLTRLSLAAFYRDAYAEAYVTALEAIQLHEQLGSHWPAATAYSIAASIAGDAKRDANLALLYSEKLLQHGRSAGHLPLQRVGLGNLVSVAVASLNRDAFIQARTELVSRPSSDQYREEFYIMAADAVGHGWDGHFDIAEESLRLISDVTARNEAQRALRDALLAVAYMSRWNIDDARRYSRIALSKTRYGKGPNDTLPDVVSRDTARVLAAACSVLIGDIARGRRAMNTRIDPHHQILDALSSIGLDVARVPPMFRGYAEYLNVAIRTSREHRPRLNLTPAELEILRMLPGPESIADIANNLGKSKRTVAHQIESIYSKLSVRGRFQAVERARSVGILAP